MSKGEAYEWLLENASVPEREHFEHIAEEQYAHGCDECAAERTARLHNL